MKFNMLYQQILESMSRRNFLGLMGKGVAATSLAPKGALGKIATSLAKPTNISARQWMAAHPALVKLFCTNAAENFEYNAKEFIDDPNEVEVAFENGYLNAEDYLKSLNVNQIKQEFSGVFDVPINKLDELEAHESESEREEIKKEQERNKEQERKKYAASINYSRADRAGGSEDEGYAKYYESKKS